MIIVLKKIKFVFIERQFTELDSLAIVAIVTIYHGNKESTASFSLTISMCQTSSLQHL